MVFSGLELRADPVLGDRLAHLRSGLVVPIYFQGEPLYFNIAFRRPDHAFPDDHIEQALLMANLVGSGNSRLLMTEEINRLNARLTQQLEEVAEVQRSLLPKRKPDISGLDIAVSYLTSDQAGGDYYDFFPFDDGTWGILIADVSGHGPAAATIMAMLRGILHAYAAPDRSPAAVLRYANERLVEAGIEGTFITAFLAVYDPATARVTFARAGHNPPILKDGRTGAVATLDGAGALPLGITPDFPIEAESVTLRPRDTLVLYTDGITEAFNASREMFGPERLDHALEKCSGEPECVVDSVHGALFSHTGSRTRADDQTLIALRYNGVARPEGELRVMAGAARVGV
jgi:sigma-B regulation protein RsbU (phosphoserine phosphatase)